MALTQSPVQKIIKRSRGNLPLIKNLMYVQRIGHNPDGDFKHVKRVLGAQPKPTLERILNDLNQHNKKRGQK